MYKRQGTTFGTAFRGASYKCTAFDTTHFCEPKTDTMVQEGLNLRSDCKNISAIHQLYFSFFERGTEETTNSLTIPAGSSKSYNKMYSEVNASNKAYPIKAMCMGSNATDSHVSNVLLSGWTKEIDIPDYLSGNGDDFCFFLPTTVTLNQGDGHEFVNTLTIESDSTGFAKHELLNVTIHDECEYVARDGSIKKDYFKRDTNDQKDCGAIPIQYPTIRLIS